MYKIAIIDDENDILNLLERFFQREFEVKTFSNPINGLNDILQNNYDLILCDIMMPQMDGIELLNKLRSNNNHTKVIMITAHDTIDRALAAHKFGASNYLKKPFDSLKNIRDIIIKEIQS